MKYETNINSSYPTNFFYINEIILVISGLRFPNKNVHALKRILYCLYSFSLYGTALTFFVLEVLKLSDTVKDPAKFFSHIGLLFTHIVGILKACLLYFGRSRIENVMEALQNQNFHYESFEQFLPALKLHKSKRRSAGVTILVCFLFWYSMAGLSAFASAWTSITMNVKGQHFEGNVTCYDFLPFYFQIPFPTETKSQCEHAFTFMVVALCAFAWYIASHDAMFCTLIYCLKTQLDILSEAIKTIRGRTLKKLFFPTNFAILHDKDCPVLEKALYKELNHCIKHLMSLLEASNDLETIFTYITLSQTVGSILIISSCLFVAATSSKASTSSTERRLLSEDAQSNQHGSDDAAAAVAVVPMSAAPIAGTSGTLSSPTLRSSTPPLTLQQQIVQLRKELREFKESQVPIKSPIFFSQAEYFLCILLQLWLICRFGNEITFSVCRGSFSYFTVFKSIR
ncbi:hypothetical protein NQ315_015969 [Exocentrus adspersus]|uniref:Odorant receptor n=1 Tax=Exocentrus adspersus TaxID=1586481 RepID=A0AAV8VJW9_9CUCU|nr:hypothetical protein NQ315_015969 [Exocentrus adspersus]